MGRGGVILPTLPTRRRTVLHNATPGPLSRRGAGEARCRVSEVFVAFDPPEGGVVLRDRGVSVYVLERLAVPSPSEAVAKVMATPRRGHPEKITLL